MSAQSGNKVRVHYTGYLEDGSVFDTSRSEDREALEFTLGEGTVIPGFENGVLGMDAGQTRTIEVPPEEGYRERNEELVFEVAADQFPEGLELRIGMLLTVGSEDGEVPDTEVSVAEITEDAVVLDGNHPLAGHTLKFDLELLEIVT